MQLIAYKGRELELEFTCELLNWKVIALVYLMAVYAMTHFGRTLTITEVWREVDAAGTHKNWRAVDIRNRNFTKAEALELAEYANKVGRYDFERPEKLCCLVYELDPNRRHEDHFHVQVHPNTEICHA